MIKTAVVTGATGDIGRAAIKVLIEDGFRVCAVYNSNSAVRDELLREYPELSVKAADVSSFDEAERLYNEIYRELGSISVSVHCAGTQISKLLPMMSYEEWNRVISVNLNGTFNCCKCAVKKMIPKGFGRIINISSAAARIANEGQAAYAASKAGVNALTKVLAKETARFGITVNAIAPGFVSGKMAKGYAEKYMEHIPAGRLATAAEIAKLIKFLADEDSGYITGAIYDITGGL